MQTKPFSLQSPEAIAKEYGGNKQSIARAAQMGLVDPTAAVLAGMFIDRMRTAATQEQAPQQTVAQRVLSPQAQAPVGLGATPAAQQMGNRTGVDSLPVDESMVPNEYAGGGVVAFAAGESVRDPYNYRPFSSPFEQLTDEEQKKLKGASLSEALDYIRRKYVTPAADYLASDPLRRAVAEPAPKAPAAPVDVDNRALLNRADAALRSAPAEVSRDESSRIAGLLPPESQAPAAGTAGVTPSSIPRQDMPTLESILSERQRLVPGGEAFSQLEKDVLSDREKRAAEKSEAGWLRLAEAGFGIAAGTSPYFAVNVGKGATEALKGYAADLKEQKKLDREDRKVLADIEQARRAEKRGDVDKATETYMKVFGELKADDRARIQAETSERVAKIYAGAPGGEEKLIDRISRDPKFAATYGRVIRQRGETKSRDAALKEWSDNIILQKQFPRFEDYYSSVSGGIGGMGGRFEGFSARPIGQ